MQAEQNLVKMLDEAKDQTSTSQLGRDGLALAQFMFDLPVAKQNLADLGIDVEKLTIGFLSEKKL